jgi:hypothetical protein
VLLHAQVSEHRACNKGLQTAISLTRGSDAAKSAGFAAGISISSSHSRIESI